MNEFVRSPIYQEKNMSPSRYKAKVDGVFPAANRDSFADEAVCFLGVSLGNQSFTEPKFKALVDWVAKRFDKCQVLIGDSIYRITLGFDSGLSDDEAYANAIAAGDQFVDEHASFLPVPGSSRSFQFVRCSEIQKRPSYSEYFKQISDAFDTNADFSASVNYFSENYHRRALEKISEEEKNIRIARSNQYFIEEFAIFSCLVEDGCTVMVYPGTFSTLAEIAEGKFPGLFSQLEKLSVVSLHFKKR